jgi:hypothetical protein
MAHFKLGRKALVTDSRTLRLARYFSPTLAPPPASVDWTKGITQWGMMLNDTLGDCTIAGVGHAIQVFTANSGSEVTLPDQTILDYYEWWDGYVDGDPSTDNGGIELQVLNKWKKKKFWGHRLNAYADPDVSNLTELQQAINLFGGVYIGLNVPQSVMNTDDDPSVLWDVTGDDSIVGGHCLCPETRVLTDDLQWVPIESIKVGQVLTGFQEHSRTSSTGAKRKFESSVVEAVAEFYLPCYELEFADGTVVRASHDHKWLCVNGSKFNWIETEKMRPQGPSGNYSTSVWKICEVWDEDVSKEAGYLAAAFDGEGWIDRNNRDGLGNVTKLGFAQRPNIMWDEVTSVLQEKGFKYHSWDKKGSFQKSGTVNHLTISRRAQFLKFLGAIRPKRLLSGFSPSRLGAVSGIQNALIRKTPIGNKRVVGLQTSSRTFIAEGMASHNCVFVPKYTQETFTCISWGQLYTMTEAFWLKFVDESHALLSPDFLGANGLDPQGFNLKQLQADLAAIV